MGSRGRGMAGGLRPGPTTMGGQRREGLGAHARLQLTEAWDRVAAGDDTQAAGAFEQLALRASERGDHVMALHLAVEGARALLRAGQFEPAVEAARTAAAFGAAARRPQKSARALARVVHELRAAGRDEDAATVDGEARARLGLGALPAGEALQAPTVNRAMRRALPKRCATCGLGTDRLERSDDGIADCGWCGSTLTA